VPPQEIGDALADAYNALHDEELSLFPEAHETLDRLKELGVKLALITNGAAGPQREPDREPLPWGWSVPLGIVGPQPAVCETKVTQVMDFARQHQHPLQCTLEKD
jgi:hypothetical protein